MISLSKSTRDEDELNGHNIDNHIGCSFKGLNIRVRDYHKGKNKRSLDEDSIDNDLDINEEKGVEQEGDDDEDARKIKKVCDWDNYVFGTEEELREEQDLMYISNCLSNYHVSMVDRDDDDWGVDCDYYADIAVYREKSAEYRMSHIYKWTTMEDNNNLTKEQAKARAKLLIKSDFIATKTIQETFTDPKDIHSFPLKNGDKVLEYEIIHLFKLDKKGCYGVYEVLDIEEGKRYVAKIGMKKGCKTLVREFETLNSIGLNEGIAKTLACFKWKELAVAKQESLQDDSYEDKLMKSTNSEVTNLDTDSDCSPTKPISWCLILITKYGPELTHLSSYPIPIYEFLKLASQMITSVEYVHQKGYLHRGIKPDNFVFISHSDRSKLLLIDLGAAKPYCLPDQDGGLIHVEYQKDSKVPKGNAWFMSPNHHKGIRRSRRDDLITLGYTFVFCATGSLPWSYLVHSKYNDYKVWVKNVERIKDETSLETLCAGLPNCFLEYFKIVFGLSFYAQPNYIQLRRLFSNSVTQKSHFHNNYSHSKMLN